MARAYSMQAVQHAALRAVALVREVLLAEVAASQVHDVQEDPRFQHRGVDLLWEHAGGQVLGVEVKGDRQGRRGTYFLELVSNAEKDTPGCFLYSRADLLAYVFLDRRELHLLPLPAVRDWFLARASEFPLRQAQTRVSGVRYTTVGASVPARRVLAEVNGARRLELRRGNAAPGTLR
ncbi:MAG: hypothetical protein ACXWK5_09980 [Myxococcaceae bacterium]